MSHPIEEPSELSIGSFRFEPRKLAGAGATSEVWKARDAETGAFVALKLAKTEDDVDILAAEAERLAYASSPLLPSLVDVGRTPGGFSVPGKDAAFSSRAYIAMTWVVGQPLSAVVSRAAQEQRKLAISVARDVGEALAHLHAAGVAHGDVKPSNILLTLERDDPRAALVDLGLSGDATANLPAGGTPRYLPPEFFTKAAVSDGRARDRYALGLVLAELCDPDLVSAADLAAAARLAKLPPPIDRWCAALLSPEPGARPSASWVADQARIASGVTDKLEDARARFSRVLSSTYLGSRRTEIARAARAAHATFEVSGPPRRWLEHAVDMGRRVFTLRGGTLATESARIRDADSLARARWLVAVVGAAAARWPLESVSHFDDGRWAEAMLSLSLSTDPGAWTPALFESALPARGLVAPNAVERPFDSPVAVALALSGTLQRRAIEAIERGDFAIPILTRAAADALRRRGEAGRALALLAKDDAPDAHALRAEIARRAGDRALAAEEARAALAHDPKDDRAHAILARLEIEARAPEHALQLLEGAPRTAATVEARAIALAASGDRRAAEKELATADALAASEEARGRVAGLVGFVAHANGDVGRAAEAYARAALHAERAEALVEEATYLTGEAGAAVDLGDIGRALEASRRASLLWEHLGRPADAGLAMLARAAAFSAVGAKHEAIAAAAETRERAQTLADRRLEAFACWAVTDVLHAGDPDGAEPARVAFANMSETGRDEERLRALARLMRHVPVEVTADKLSWGDATASRSGVLAAARLEWWRARAERFAAGQTVGRGESVVAEVCHLASEAAPIAARGPAFAAAALLASQIGDGNAVRLLARAQGEAARALLSRIPAELRESAQSLSWVRSVRGTEAPLVSAEQIAEFESLVHSLGTRDRLRPLLEQVLDSLILWTGVERGLLLLSAPNGKLVPRAARNLLRVDLTGEQRLLSQSLAVKALELGEPVVAVDAAGEMASVHESVHALKLRSVLAIPLVARGRSLGVVYLDDRMRKGAFGPRELAWVKLVASLAAVAICDARDQILLRRAARRAERAKHALLHELSRREAELDAVARELARTREMETRFRYDAIIGKSRAMTDLLKIVDRVTVSTVPVLVIGESGSGKELVARAIHENGSRAGRTFVGENCAAIPETLLESTLFGHMRGAFTGADRARAGLFEVAHQGTLFLDEVGEMSLPMQAKLLRVLEEGEVRPLGSERGRRVDVRVIAATNRNLEQMVREGKFREDLFYRLNVISLRVPPLRERTEDIALLVGHFIEKHGQGRKLKVSAAALGCLRRYEWPGNVRQLENEVRRAIVLADDTIDVEHLSADVQRPKGAAEPVGLRVKPRVDALEAELVQAALLETRGNQTKAAEKLGLSRFGLQKMIKRLGIKAPS